MHAILERRGRGARKPAGGYLHEIVGDLSFGADACPRLEPRTVVYGSVNVGYRSQLDALPEWLWVTGDLTIDGERLAELPCGLRVDRRLVLGPAVTHIGPKTTVTWLNVMNASIQTVPGDLWILDTFIAVSNASLKRLPKGFAVQWDCFLNRSALPLLPERMVVGGNLNVEDSALEALPGDLLVDGEIWAAGSRIPKSPRMSSSLFCCSRPSFYEGLPDD